MEKIKMERIVKTYYDALEEGKVLGRKCLSCGHIEFPPYLCCNECGGLDTEWIDLTNVRAKVTQILPPLIVFPETEYKEANGGFMAVSVQIEDAHPVVSTLVHADSARYDELHDKLDTLVVRPTIVQGEDTKVAVWELDGDEATDRWVAEHPAGQAAAKNAASGAAATEAAAAVNVMDDEVVKTVIACTAEAYEIDEEEITLQTDIREDLSNQSMKMIAMLAGIEEELDVTIEIPEAGNLNTILEFVNRVKEKKGQAPIGAEAGNESFAAAQTEAAGAVSGADVMDEVAKTVIACAAEAYEMEEDEITLDTDIREDLSNQSMKMIAMLAGIEEELDVTIEIPEAGNLNTIRDFVELARSRR